MFNNLIEHTGIFPPGTEYRVGRRLGSCRCRQRFFLVNLPKEQTGGFGHRVIDRRKPAAVRNQFN
jgi:hypothetical protein